ncbi:MAG: homoserine dehydrogenase, partial [Mesorhizobium sp.]
MTNVALTGLARDLARRAAEGRPVRIGVIGSGEMGTDLVTQGMLMPGISVAAISTRRPHTARDAIRIAYGDEAMAAEADTASKVSQAIESGRIAITSNEMLVTNPLIDVVIDATGKPGDEPSSCMELIEFASALGYTIVSAGKGKNNPLNHDAVPDDYREEALRRNMNPRMLVEFVDGSKTMVEMCAIANATGLVPDVPGMHGPKADRDELAKVLIPKADGGILSKKGVVDYTIGKGVAPGVFCIIETKHPRVLERMIDLKVGKGPYFTIFRPYHLTSLEVPLSAARAVVYKRADMEPLDHPVAEAVAVAKSNLGAGQSLGMIGENDYRGFAMTWEDARARGALPLGLAERAKVVKPVKAGDFLTYENCVPDDSMVITQIRRRLDQSDGRFVTN